MSNVDRDGYVALHSWVAQRLGRPKLCSRCGFTSENSRQFHWANISGEYKRDLADFERLCVSCHAKQDKRKEACPQGHPYTEESTYVRPGNGSREFKICRLTKQRAAFVPRPLPLRTHCNKGHELAKVGYYVRGMDGYKICKSCTASKNKFFYAKFRDKRHEKAVRNWAASKAARRVE